MVSARTLCKRLLQTSDPQRRERLLDAAATPECVAFLLEEARNVTNAAPQEALEFADLAIEITGRRNDSQGEALAWRIRAQALRVFGRHAEALTAFEEATARAHAAGDAKLAAQVQIGRVDSLGWLGRYEDALTLACHLEDELRAYGLAEDAAKVLVNAGSLHFRRDQYAAALDCYQRALDVLDRSGDKAAVARVQANCANILTQLNRVDEAIELYEQARAVFAGQGMGPTAAMVDANVGFLRYISGEYSTALASLSRARQEFAARGQELETAKCDADMADVYRVLNLYPEALECYKRAIQVFERIPLDYERARAEVGRAGVRMALNQPEEAFTALERADLIFRAQSNRLQRAHVRLMRAYLLRSVGRVADACAEARTAARALARSGLRGWAAEARFLLAEVALEEGRDATRIMRSVSRVAGHHARGWLACRAERALGLYYLRRTDVERALRHFRRGVSALEQTLALVAPEDLHVAFLRDKLTIYEDIVVTLLAGSRRGKIAEALEYVERSKSRLLLERVQTALDGRPIASAAVDAATRERLAVLRAELCRNCYRIGSFGDGERRGFMAASADTIASPEQAYRAALRDIELAELASASAGGALVPVVPAERLRAALRPDETLVEFYVVHGAFCAFLLTREEVRIQWGVAQLEDVTFAARRLRYHLQRGEMQAEYVQSHAAQMHTGIQSALQHLHNLLLMPLQAMLTTEKIVLVPHGVLHGLPFHAFFDGAQYALDRWEFVYAPSAAIWYAGVRRARAKEVKTAETVPSHSALLMGVPDPAIERAAVEVEQLARLLPKSRVFCAERATLEAFRRHAICCRWIHLATHALYRADNPLFSGLRFSDGWLLARDLYEMALNCELATLSACRTGVAFVEPGDELFGLIRGFLSAGVRSLAVSLWPADDAATAALMVRFYTLLARGVPKAEALRAAQRETRTEYTHPYHWAAFALIGER